MPATPEHKAAVHQLARERVNAGRPVWAHTIDLSHVFHNEAMSFIERRDAIVRIVRASRWVKAADEFSDLTEAVEELSDTADLAEFNLVWDAIYDLADYDRVWIITR